DLVPYVHHLPRDGGPHRRRARRAQARAGVHLGVDGGAQARRVRAHPGVSGPCRQRPGEDAMSAAERKAAPEEGWESLTVDELREELESRGLKKSGTKDELVARLTEDDEAGAAPEEETEEQPARPRGSAETITEEKKAAPTRPDGAVIVSASAKYVRSAPRKARLV